MSVQCGSFEFIKLLVVIQVTHSVFNSSLCLFTGIGVLNFGPRTQNQLTNKIDVKKVKGVKST